MSGEPKHTATQEYQSDCICDTECRGFVNVKCKVAKQETLEEVANNYAKESLDNDPIRILAFIKGAKWQSEQTKSELQSLRAERDGLVEALRAIEQFSDFGDGILSGSIAVVRMKSIATQTLAKYEKP